MASKQESGQAVVLVALALVAFVGAAALTVDVGQAYRVASALSNAAMTAALSGAHALPADKQHARQLALTIASDNGLDPNHVHVSFSSSDGPEGPADQITVTVTGTAVYHFAKLFGYDHRDLTESATAQIGETAGLRGLVPLGVPQGEYTMGQTYNLKSGNPSQGPGNFGLLALGGSGGSNLRDKLQHGYQQTVRIGDELETETGDNVGPVRQGLQPRIDADPAATCTTVQPGSPRLLAVPVIDFSGAHGRSSVSVTGFASFFLERTDGASVQGCFLGTLPPGEWGPLTGNDGFGIHKTAALVRP